VYFRLVSRLVASKDERYDEIDPDAPEDDDAFADMVRAFEACDKAYELLTGHLYDMTPDGEVTDDYLVLRRIKALSTEAPGDPAAQRPVGNRPTGFTHFAQSLQWHNRVPCPRVCSNPLA
jgi:hypothetical protein